MRQWGKYLLPLKDAKHVSLPAFVVVSVSVHFCFHLFINMFQLDCDLMEISARLYQPFNN